MERFKRPFQNGKIHIQNGRILAPCSKYEDSVRPFQIGRVLCVVSKLEVLRRSIENRRILGVLFKKERK